MKYLLGILVIYMVGQQVYGDFSPVDYSPLDYSFAFKCQSDFKTYTVYSSTGLNGSGVRCVKVKVIGYDPYNEHPIYGIYWYGEGKWNSTKYRHIGRATYRPDNITLNAIALDIYGNGESTSHRTKNLRFNQKENFKEFVITGEWNERWVLEEDGISRKYSSSLPPVKKCGPNFTQYRVSDATGSTDSATGIRCLAFKDNDSLLPLLWYGEGEWSGNSYKHYGSIIKKEISKPFASAFSLDICNRVDICGHTESLTIKALRPINPRALYRITGDWNEYWLKN